MIEDARGTEQISCTHTNHVLPKQSNAYHKDFLLLDGLETSMTKFGGGVDEFEVDLLLGTAAGLNQKRFAQSQNPLLGSNHAAFQHEEIIGHLTIMHKTTLIREQKVSL